MHLRSLRVLIPALLVLAACSQPATPVPLAAPSDAPRAAPAPDAPPAPLFDGLGDFHRAISTKSPEVQRYFDQGLLLTYAFNNTEAVRSFSQACALDPDCAMAFWGKALASGPNINRPSLDEATTRVAVDAIERAVALAERASPLERALIAALRKRYAWPPPVSRAPLDAAYADAMREVWHAHPDDPDVGALFAEALLDVRPWDQWTPDGKPQPGTLEAVETVEAVLKKFPDHPDANHIAIHALEASPFPERALPAADRLRTLAPGAGHLVHMSSHIDIRVGHYETAIEANRRALAADRAYFERAGAPTGYATYRAHAGHFLTWAAMYDGQSAVALEAARALVRDLPADLVAKSAKPWEAFFVVPYHVLVRFGKWDAMLAEPEPPAGRPAQTAFWHYARAMACSSLRRVDDAERELAAFDAAVVATPPTYTLAHNPMSAVFPVARGFAAGEIEYRRGRFDAAFQQLRAAVALDDGLRYGEPWGFMQPVRHALGALLCEQGRIDEAEAVYREDLERHPENGWSLHGLLECLRRRGEKDPAAAALAADTADVERRFERAWARADVQLPGSCFCRIGH